MYFSRAPLSSVAYAIFFASAQASYLQSELSFGHNDRISPNLRAVPDWHLIGTPHPPEILSNRLVLTPPAPGNQRGAVWSEKVLQHSSWTVDVDFRATGPERGGGNLQIWYAKDGQTNIGTSSIYTVGKFDGMALIVDQYAGSGGYLRGFLNDGNNEYKSHHSVDSLAFGHCEYSYRNLGRPSRIQINHTPSSLRVLVDGRTCFETDKVKLPRGYNFGVSAASAENPDSFEVFKFVTTTEQHSPDGSDPNQEPMVDSGHTAPPINQGRAVPQPHGNEGDIPSFSDPPEVAAKEIVTSEAQFADLHNRLQNMMKHISALNRDHNEFVKQAEKRHDDLMGLVRSLQNNVAEVKSLKGKMDEVQRDVRQTKMDMDNALNRHMLGVRGDVREAHATISSMSRAIGKWLLIILASQGILVGGYVFYKKRTNREHKKYL